MFNLRGVNPLDLALIWVAASVLLILVPVPKALAIALILASLILLAGKWLNDNLS